jgi:hypothetical protein
MRTSAAVVAVACGLSGAACSLILPWDYGGTPDGGAGSDAPGGPDVTGDAATPSEAGSDARLPDGSETDGSVGGSCDAGVPSGWTLVVYGPGAGDCPVGYGVASSVVTNPLAGPGACSCGCEVTSAPSCSQGEVTGEIGLTGPPCSEALSMPSDGTCTMQLMEEIPAYLQVSPLPPTGGSCATEPVVDPTKVTTTPGVLCDVSAASAEAACSGAIPSGFSACIASASSASCPPGSPFQNQVTVASAETLTCSCSSCSLTTMCSNAQVLFYPDGCGSQAGVVTLAADGQCNPTNSSVEFSGLQYEATAEATCSANAVVGFEATGAQTVCCR